MHRAAPLLLLVLLLAACGGSSKVTGGSEGEVAAPPSIENRGTATIASTSVVLRMGDDWFQPTVLRAPAGARIALVVRNVGELPHAFDLDARGQKVDVSVAPGASATVHVRVPAFGRILFFCKYHWSRGMAGYLEPGR